MDALLFRPSSIDGPPEWKVCADDWVDFYQDRGWFLLAREQAIAEQRAADHAVRRSDEDRWAPPPLERRRSRWRARRRRLGSTGE